MNGRARYSDHAFADDAAVATALAAAVAARLDGAITTRGAAVLAVSGGTTPLRFFAELSRCALDWSAVTVTLCDERWVPPTHPRSNAKLVNGNLLQGPASAARFVPLYDACADTPEGGCEAVQRRMAALAQPFDVAVLGMGEDGHTASLFPDGDRIFDALDPHTAALVLPMRAPAAGEPRITLTLPPLAAARHAFLQIEGARKLEVFSQIVDGSANYAGNPLRAVMLNRREPLAVYRC
jgi:6-phosphogluconolactonase